MQEKNGKINIINEMPMTSKENGCNDIGNLWTKKCPQCNKNQPYRNKRQLLKAIRHNTICKTCKIKNQEIWKNSSVWKKHSVHLSTIWNKHCPRCNTLQYYKNKRSYDRSIKRNAVCRRCQLIIRKPTYLDNPNYNPKACNYFNKLNEENGWNLQHASNGGEIKVVYYFVDAYDKDRNIVVEYDEPCHKYYDKQKDAKRQVDIINELQCDFYRYDEATNTLKCVADNMTKPIGFA